MAGSIDQQSQAVLDLAQSALSTARTTASRIGGFTPSLTNAAFSYNVSQPAMSPPPKFSDLFPGADTSDEQVKWLNGEVDKWIEKFFPELAMCLKTLPEEWLCGILSGEKEFGLDRTVFEVIWQRAREREYRASGTEAATLRNEFSHRGFSLPPGVMIQVHADSERRAAAAISEVNREQMIREAEIKLDLLKFAEEQAIRLKLGVMDAMRAFYMAWIQLPDKDLRAAEIRARAQADFYRSLSSYYDVNLGFEQLRLRAAEAKAGIQIDNNRVAVSNNDSGRNSALGSAVQGFTQTAAAAASAGSALFADIVTGGA